MSDYNARVEFREMDDVYLTIETPYHENPHDMVLSAILNLLYLIMLGDHKFDDEVIDRLQHRIDELRIK